MSDETKAAIRECAGLVCPYCAKGDTPYRESPKVYLRHEWYAKCDSAPIRERFPEAFEDGNE